MHRHLSSYRRDLLCMLGICLQLVVSAPAVAAQALGTIEGQVALPNGEPTHGATVLLTELGRTAETGVDGRYRFGEVPAGLYEILAYQSGLDSLSQYVQVSDGATQTLDIKLRVSPLRQAITVTAQGRQESTFQAIPSVTTLDSFDLAEIMAPSLGEALDGQLGVAKRSFGSGNARPVVRGFDGDRVLVMQDSMPLGALGAQSGDHAEPIDVSNLERLEILKGPATLLYGSNAVGGVINAISSHQVFHDQAHPGLTGQVSSSIGSTNGQAGSSFSMAYGSGKWGIWAGGGGQRTNDYDTPVGVVEDSKSRVANGNVGLGWFGDRAFASVGYRGNEGRYGVPFVPFLEGGGSLGDAGGGSVGEAEAEPVDAVNVALREHTFNFTTGVRGLGTAFDEFRLALNYSDYNHDELEIFDTGDQEVGTTFENQQFVFRAVLTQRPNGPLSGSFGVSGFHRDYESVGEEALAPPVTQNNFAAFVLEDIDFEHVQLQLGARIDHNQYMPQASAGFSSRSLTGVSAGLGARFPLWQGGAFVANYTDSFRSPALEELYNNGPHVGTLTFEIGNPDLERERSHGIDFSLRHQTDRIQGEANFFYYDIDDFVYLAETGAIQDNLREAQYSQADARFVGGEIKVGVSLKEQVFLNLGFDTVDAQLKADSTRLPRTPPLRATIGLEIHAGGFSIEPEIVMVDARSDVFDNETPTAGYALANLKASYTIPRQHLSHHLAMDFFNMGGTLYRNHVSFIKELAPEIGRGVRFSYTVKFF